MKRRLLVAAGVLFALLVAAGGWLVLALRPPPQPPPARAAPPSFTLTGVTVIEPGRGRTAGSDVAVANGVIRAVAPTGAAAAADTLAAYRGAFVLPGLVDFHSHLPPATPLQLTRYFELLYLAHGVTSLREAGDIDGTAVPAARKVVAEGTLPGPRIFACGPFLGGEPPRWPNTLRITSVAEAEAAVEVIAEAGFDCVKSYEDLDRAEVQALIAAARKRGLRVIGHVPTDLAYEEALLPEAQHFLGVPPPESLRRDDILDRMADWHAVDEARMDEIVRVSLEHHLANTPTMVLTHQVLMYRDYEAARRDPAVRLLPRFFSDALWHPTHGNPLYTDLDGWYLDNFTATLEKKKRLVRKLWEAGAELHLGTDTIQPFVVPGVSMHQEMRLFHEAGVPVEQVWAMATWRAGALLPEPGLGRLVPGAPADLLVFRRDPTADLAALDSLEAVVAGGVLMTRADLTERIAAWRAHFDDPVFDRVSMAMAPLAIRHSVKRDY